MATKNPTLSEIRTPVEILPDPTPSPKVLEGAAMIGETVIARKRDNILEEFRGDVSNIVQRAESQVLSPEDESFVGTFAQRMSRIQSIVEQGGSSARTQALLEAETALREAQGRRPGLAAELRQEASLVLGEDPTGTRLRMMDDLQASQSASNRAAWEDYLKRSRELGIPMNLEGTQSGFALFESLENADFQRQFYLREIELKNAANQMGEASQTYDELVLNGERSYAVIEGVINELNGAINSLTTQEQDAFRRNEIGIQAFGSDSLTMDQAVARLESIKSEIGLRLDTAGLGAWEYERASNVRDTIGAYIDSTIATLQNTDQDAAAFESSISLLRSQFFMDMPASAQRMVMMTDVGKEFFTLIQNSPYPSENLSLMTALRTPVAAGLEMLIGYGIGDSRTLNQAARAWDERYLEGLSSNDYSGQPNADELYLQDNIIGLQDLARLAGDAELSPTMQESIAYNLYAQVTALNKISDPSESVVQQWLALFSTPAVTKALANSAPYVTTELARELQTTFTEYAEMPNNVADEMASYTVRHSRLPLTQFLSADISNLEEDGRIGLTVDTTRMLADARPRASNKAREWSEKLTNLVRAEATFQALLSNSEPNYVRAYQDLIQGRSEFGLTFPNIGVTE